MLPWQFALIVAGSYSYTRASLTTRRELRMKDDKAAYTMIDGEVIQFQRVIKATIDAMEMSYPVIMFALADLLAQYTHKVANMEARALLEE